MKIITVVGARPQFIKAASVSRAFAAHPNIEEIIVHTGQHFDTNMSDVFFDEMQIPRPQYALNIHNLSHGAMTGRMMEQIESVLKKENPDYLLVYGDTNSTLAGALAAKKLHIKVIHIEAGLRSFNMGMPEEVNRILTDRISDLLFCPTQAAIDNLGNEGYSGFNTEIHLSGDVMEDAARFYAKAAEEKSSILHDLKLESSGFILATLHRAENTDDPTRLSGIIQALNHLNRSKRVVVPLHPRTRGCLDRISEKPEFDIIDPVGYFDMIRLLQECALVITDSGGLQKEAYFFDKYCVTTRDETEWTELVSCGFNVLVGAETNAIISQATAMLNKPFISHIELFGGGKAADRIAAIIANKKI